MKAAKVADVKHTMKGNTLVIEGASYTVDTVDKIPARFHPSATSTRENDDTVKSRKMFISTAVECFVFTTSSRNTK